MASDQEVLRFIQSSFRSVWSLEVLLALKRDQRSWAPGELVEALRASDLVIAQALSSLVAAGLVAVGPDGSANYMPASPEIAGSVERAETLYARRPDAVRRAIIAAASPGLTAFADAFRLRRD